MRCDREYDDGAYVIGALSPAERAAYERHLNTCSFCRQAVAELAVIPGLLGRLDPADVARILEPDPPKVVSRNRMPELVTAVQVSKRRDHRRGRRRTMGTAVVAAALTLVVGAGTALAWPEDSRPPGGATGSATGVGPANAGGPTTLSAPLTSTGETRPPALVPMRPVGAPNPLSAEVNLASATWGTLVTLKCVYAKTGTSSQAYSFRMFAYGPDDAREEIGSWTAVPGVQLQIPGATRFGGKALARIEVVRYDDTPVLAYDVP